MQRKLLAVFVLTAAASPAAVAQMYNMQPIQIPQPQPAVAPLHCGDFERHADGTWSPLHPVVIPTRNGPVPVKAGAQLREGTPVSGTDVAATLNRECMG
jgi:hypothetical protein